MATVSHRRLDGCDGFRIESAAGAIGWVEEVWRGRPGEPSAVALRTFDGRRALLTGEDVIAVHPEDSLLVARADAAMLELAPPRVERWTKENGHRSGLTASWSTTGAVVELPAPAGRLRAAMFTRRPWSLGRMRRPGGAERPLWQTIVGLYVGLASIVLLVITLAFVIARLVTGSAY